MGMGGKCSGVHHTGAALVGLLDLQGEHAQEQAVGLP